MTRLLNEIKRRFSIKLLTRSFLLGFVVIFATAGQYSCDFLLNSFWENLDKSTKNPRFYINGLMGNGYTPVVHTIVYANAGNEDLVIIGGHFDAVGGVEAHNIAVYNTQTGKWSAVFGGGLVGNDGFESAVYSIYYTGLPFSFGVPSSAIIVGGSFTRTYDGTTQNLNNIASLSLRQFQTGPWNNFGGGLDETVRAVTVLNPSGPSTDNNNYVIAGGDFTQTAVGGLSLNYIGRYRLYCSGSPCQTGWSAVDGNGLNGEVYALDNNRDSGFYADQVYVGGAFTQLANNPGFLINRLATYSVSGWTQPTNNGLNNDVYALRRKDTSLYVGGAFTQTNSPPTILNRIARYDLVSGAWSPLSPGLNGNVRAIAFNGDDVYVGGQFTRTSDSISILNRVAVYLSSGVWNALPGNGLNERVNALEVVDYDQSASETNLHLFAGGEFTGTVLGGFFENSGSLAEVSIEPVPLNLGAANNWSGIGPANGKALNREITSLAADANGNIYAGGLFTRAANDSVTNLNRIARFDPMTNNWSPLANNGLNGGVTSLAIDGNFLYVGGSFTATADGAVTNLNRVARYNLTTNTWSALGNNGLNSSVNALAVSGGNLYVGGAFVRTFDSAVTNLNRIARYNLTTNIWSPLAFNGLNNDVFAIAVAGDNLYLGGFFSRPFSSASPTMSYIGRYNTVTNTWSALSNNGLNELPHTINVSENYLNIKGQFIGTGDNTINLTNGHARYNTQTNTWEAPVGDPQSMAVTSNTAAIVQSGNEVYFGGSFLLANGRAVQNFTALYLQQWKDNAPTNDWFNATNWATEAVPAANTNAAIPVGSGNVQINSADVVLKDLIMGGGTLTIGTGRTLTINGILDLSGGIINGAGTVVITNCQPDGIMGGDSTSYIQTALVRCVNNSGTFNFEVGTANGYSPITIKAVSGTGNISVKANQGAYSNPAAGLPSPRLARWWQIENPGGGVTEADVFFNYLQSDIVGNEDSYAAYRISGGNATMIPSTVNTFSKVVTVPNVTSFSDWTLGPTAPTAANVSVSGRILTANGQGIRNVRVTLTDSTGASRTAITGSFGYYRFDNVEAGGAYIISLASKRYTFDPPTRVIVVNDEVTDIDWIAEPSP